MGCVKQRCLWIVFLGDIKHIRRVTRLKKMVTMREDWQKVAIIFVLDIMVCYVEILGQLRACNMVRVDMIRDVMRLWILTSIISLREN
jgi:hypothetical protein